MAVSFWFLGCFFSWLNYTIYMMIHKPEDQHDVQFIVFFTIIKHYNVYVLCSVGVWHGLVIYGKAKTRPASLLNRQTFYCYSGFANIIKRYIIIIIICFNVEVEVYVSVRTTKCSQAISLNFKIFSDVHVEWIWFMNLR